jgi:ADP-heptose:LPS heptosyltransferase
MALIPECAFLVCNDSGPMHIAGALGVPTVAIFSSGVDKWFSPLGEGHALLKGTLHVADVPTSQVLDALERRLQTARAANVRSG